VRVVFCHSSDEQYGADRILLDVVDVLSAETRENAQAWVPSDLAHGRNPLCHVLEARGVAVQHVALPIVRRAYLNPRGLSRLAGRAWRLWRTLRRTRPDVVYCTTSAAFLCAPVARLAGVDHVVGHVQEVWGARDSRLLTGPARACHQLLTISESVRDALPAALQARATVVRNATPDPGPVTAIAEHRGPLRFVIAGRWNRVKGHGTLLRAWDAWNGDAELVVLGGPPPSGEVVDVPGLVRRIRRPETVRVVGEVPDPGPWLDEADVVLVPSDEPEGFGLTAAEAFARGRPVVGSDNGGIREIVTDGRDGWLFPPGDSARLAEVLGTLDRDGIIRAGAAARSTYEHAFTPGRYAAEWRAALPYLD
jgi:glycosyltransferase involved in cell wall biosynthesis